MEVNSFQLIRFKLIGKRWYCWMEKRHKNVSICFQLIRFKLIGKHKGSVFQYFMKDRMFPTNPI